ncbi:hypothetical protein ACO1O0_000134 [Amphichorda felina]
MGGLAFSSGPDPLYTPRMPKGVYLEVKHRCFEILKTLFEVVESPIDGPGKTDFGDVDILLFGPKSPRVSKEDMIESLKAVLGATRTIVERSEETALNLAIPWPTSNPQLLTSDCSPPLLDSIKDTQEASQGKHIQVDVRVCRDMHRLRWTLFKHAHGDIWNMIGSTIRPYGLTVDEDALWLRIPEVEKNNKRRAKIMLSSDPDQILHFVGLSSSEYWKGPFEDFHAMAEYVAQCRMFWVPPTETQEGQEAAEARYSEDRKKLKANDRRRMNLRPGFRKWIHEFYPECRQTGRYLEQKTTREQITQEAFETFGVEEEFMQRRREFLLEQQRDYIWNGVIKEAIPPPEDNSDARAIKYRGALVKAFKKIILEDDNRYGIIRPSDLKDKEGYFVTENVVDFIVRNEKEVAKVALDQQHPAFEEKKAKKEEKAGEIKEPGESST